MLNSLRQFLRILDWKARKTIIILFLPMLITTGLELFSLALVLPLIQVSVLGELSYGPLEKFIGLLPQINFDKLSNVVVITFATVFVIRNLFLLGTMYWINLGIFHIAADCTKDLFNIYLRCPINFHSINNSGILLRNLQMGVGLTLDAVKQVLVIIFDIMVLGVMVIFLLVVEPYITAGAVFFLGLIGIVYYKIFSPVFSRWGQQAQELEGERNKWVLQGFTGIKDVKIRNSYNSLVTKISKIAHKHADVYSLANTAIHIPRLLYESVVVVGAMVFLFGLILIGKPDSEVLTLLGLFAMAAMRIIPLLNRILSSASDLRRAGPYIETVHEGFSFGVKESDTKAFHDYENKIDFRKEIKLSDIVFTYPGSREPILDSINLTINRGDHVAFFGVSGAGKTTLLDIIIGLQKPDRGGVFIDGISVYENVSLWQRNIGFVSQQPFIFDDSLRNNIAFGFDKSKIEDERVVQAIKLADLYEFYTKLPEGLDTILGEGGSFLSGGQIQRVCLARSLYGDPEVLVLDEFTSSLDSATESRILDTINHLAEEKTIITITHSSTVASRCDKVVFLEHAKISKIVRGSEL